MAPTPVQITKYIGMLATGQRGELCADMMYTSIVLAMLQHSNTVYPQGVSNVICPWHSSVLRLRGSTAFTTAVLFLTAVVQYPVAFNGCTELL